MHGVDNIQHEEVYLIVSMRASPGLATVCIVRFELWISRVDMDKFHTKPSETNEKSNI